MKYQGGTRCPQSGRAIPTGITIDRESFERSPVFFKRTRCPICNADHAWFAREAWVDEPGGRARHGGAEDATSASAKRL
jgi:hypothetical protein